MANSNIINAVFGSGICAVTTSAYRANYGMKLRFSGIELPTAFECDFSNYDVSGKDSVTAIGQNNEVQIPDQLWDSGLNIYAYVYLHPTDDSGVTVYTVTIPVLGRPNRTEETPTPHEQSVIEQAISALNDAVEQTAADVETTAANADRAAQSEANAATSERAAAASAGAALASQNAAHASETASAQSAQSASGSADQASQSAQASAESADTAQGAAASAERSEQNASASAASAQSKANEAASSAATATDKATESAQSASSASVSAQNAASSAQSAESSATEAGQSATAAAQSAQSAASAAQNAASSAQSAESSATDAEQAKTDAQDAQAAAEQSAQSISGLSAQIVQNTADIADLVQSKAGVLVDTATGSIASFVPDATVPTVRGLTVNIEPVQSGTGDPSPDNIRPISGWDAVEVQRTGKNLWGGEKLADDIIAKVNGAVKNATAKTISYTAQKIDNVVLFERFNHNTQYTVILNGTGYANMQFKYSDGTTQTFGGTLSTTSKEFTSTSSKSITALIGTWSSGQTVLNYEQCGVFEGVVTADALNPYLGQTYTISLGQTVYGGTLDAVNGVLTVDRAMVTFDGSSDEHWALQSVNSYGIANFYMDVDHYPAINYRTACNMLSPQTSLITITETEGYYVHQNGSTVYIRILSSRASTVNEFKTWLSQNNIQLVYTLATPIVIDLDPVAIATIANQINNVWADSGDVAVEYAADLKTYIDQKIAAAVAALS